MLHLFPVYKKRLLFNSGLWLGFLALLILLYPEIPPMLLLLAGLVGVGVVMFMQYGCAITAHSRLLNLLYNELNAESFITQYAPLLNIPVKNAQLHLMLRLHMSNAYCALGRFDEAMELLAATKPLPASKEQTTLFRFSIASNLCYCAQQKNDLAAARKYLDELLAFKAQLEKLQESKPAKKRMTFSTVLNEQCMKFLETGKADVEYLKSQVQGNNTQQLHRIVTSLWIARVYLAENNRREAQKLLERIVELAPDLYPGQRAKELLNNLPEKNEKTEKHGKKA